MNRLFAAENMPLIRIRDQEMRAEHVRGAQGARRAHFTMLVLAVAIHVAESGADFSATSRRAHS